MSKGYVYILTNPCIQYTFNEGGKKTTISPVKIGMAKDVEKRLGSLNTSLPENFVHHMSLACDDIKAVENVVHLYLDKYRIWTKDGEKTEFFRCSVNEAKKALKQTAKMMHVKEYKIDKAKIVGRSAYKIKSNSKAAKEKKCLTPVPSETGWKNVTQLAKWIATQGGNVGAAGGVLQLLTAKRPCKPSSKWRKPFEGLGIQFDAKDFVADWRSARK